jgi:hypothetical protein
MLTFKPDPKTKRASKAVARSAGLFMARVGRAAAHLDRQEVSYAPKPWETSLQYGGTNGLVDAGGSCGGYDDFGGYDCGGGGYGGGEGGGDPYDGGGYGGGGEGGGYPSNDPAPFDPNTGEGISPNAPEVIIVGQRPERPTEDPPANIDWTFNPPPMPVPQIVPIPTNIEEFYFIPAGCFPGPRRTFVCPPAAPANPGAIPPVTMPRPKSGFVWKWQWSDIEWCKVWNTCGPKASEGTVPEGSQPDAPATHPDDILHAALEQCAAEAKAGAEYCIHIAPFRPPEFEKEQTLQCAKDILETYKACRATAFDARAHW